NTVAKMIDLCNDFGIDAIEIGHPLSVWMEATEKSWTNGDGGLKWGDIFGIINHDKGFNLPDLCQNIRQFNFWCEMQMLAQ
ncbi:MAG TPA: aldehyde ferredoxin oxidoreductase C-terminal domain-containing protein, partial [Aggregatilineales bacterium]|nr:aldehyde ferredoxin oxidoreductase C-terminal domain-containing protein [Aggregatilineales bacterium]